MKHTQGTKTLERDRYGAISMGKAVLYPKVIKHPTKQIQKMYKASIAASIAGTIFEAFEIEDIAYGSNQAAQMALTVLPFEQYQKLTRKAALYDKQRATKKPRKATQGSAKAK